MVVFFWIVAALALANAARLMLNKPAEHAAHKERVRNGIAAAEKARQRMLEARTSGHRGSVLAAERNWRGGE